MKDGGLASLRKSLVTHYDRLKRRLSARLGNDELAGDALQDAYLKLDGVAAPERCGSPRPISTAWPSTSPPTTHARAMKG